MLTVFLQMSFIWEGNLEAKRREFFLHCSRQGESPSAGLPYLTHVVHSIFKMSNGGTNQEADMAEKYDVGKGHMFANPCIFDISSRILNSAWGCSSCLNILKQWQNGHIVPWKWQNHTRGGTFTPRCTNWVKKCFQNIRTSISSPREVLGFIIALAASCKIYTMRSSTDLPMNSSLFMKRNQPGEVRLQGRCPYRLALGFFDHLHPSLLCAVPVEGWP